MSTASSSPPGLLAHSGPTPPPTDSIRDIQAALLDWYATHGRPLPWRRVRDPYRILVSEIMLQQTQVDRVIPKYEEFLERFPSVSALAKAPLSEVLRVWSPLGYNRRARYLHLAARATVERFAGELPSEQPSLRSLPGIGRYTAGALACFAFEQPATLVDTNVRRVLGRVFRGSVGVTEKEAWQLADLALPAAHAYDWNQALMDLGATICIAETPRCDVCPLRTFCQWRAEAPEMRSHVRERPATYRVKADHGAERRKWRGRIVEALRTIRDDKHASWTEVKAVLESQFGATALDLDELLESLTRDGLVERADSPSGPTARLAQ